MTNILFIFNIAFILGLLFYILLNKTKLFCLNVCTSNKKYLVFPLVTKKELKDKKNYTICVFLDFDYILLNCFWEEKFNSFYITDNCLKDRYTFEEVEMVFKGTYSENTFLLDKNGLEYLKKAISINKNIS